MRQKLNHMRLGDWKVYAGRFIDAPKSGFKNICLRAEIQPRDLAGASYFFPVVDFSIPKVRPTTFALAWIIWQGVARKRKVYVGCMGGVGRTGMVLALLARVVYRMDGGNAIARVRRYYAPHAVETLEQEKFVRAFPTTNLNKWYRICRLIAKIA